MEVTNYLLSGMILQVVHSTDASWQKVVTLAIANGMLLISLNVVTANTHTRLRTIRVMNVGIIGITSLLCNETRDPIP